MINKSDWVEAKAEVFWGEIAPNDHILQIYEDESIFIEMLAGFAGSGINAGDSVVVIASPQHLIALEARLKQHGVYLDSLKSGNSFIALDAAKTLERFMVNGWPDEEKFMALVSSLIKRARGPEGRKVRAFGEMVALLWEQGHNGATVQLEHLWNKFCAIEELSLFCAYPKAGFTQNPVDSIRNICCTHSRIITPGDNPLTEILYKDCEQKAIA